MRPFITNQIWFAWHPVQFEDGRRAWLTDVIRSGQYWNDTWVWVYKPFPQRGSNLAPLYAVLGIAMLIALVMASTSAHAAASCLSIKDRDLRSLCRAQATRRTAHCLSIKDRDLRAYCRGTSK